MGTFLVLGFPGENPPTPGDYTGDFLTNTQTFYSASANNTIPFTATSTPNAQYLNYGSDTATFPAVSIGTASSDRILVVGVGCLCAGGSTVSAVTVGGTPLTLGVSAINGVLDSQTYIYYGNIASGTSATIVVTSAPFGFQEVAICVGYITQATLAPTDTATWSTSGQPDPASVTITLPAVGVAVIMAQGGGAGPTRWVNASADLENSTGTVRQSYSLAHCIASGDQLIQYYGYGYDGESMAAVAWGAAP